MEKKPLVLGEDGWNLEQLQDNDSLPEDTDPAIQRLERLISKLVLCLWNNGIEITDEELASYLNKY